MLYELYTGTHPFDAVTLAECQHQHLHGIPRPPIEVVHDLDPAIERSLLRCLEKEPARRPATVLAVAAALPGGSPLAAMIAAGETPPPEMVAASGEAGVLSTTSALLLSVALLICLGTTVACARYAHLVNLYPGDKSPDYD